MKALVTGGSGFVGSHLVEHLIGRGDDVTALVRSETKAAPLTRLGARCVIGTLDDQAALDLAAADQQVVYHVAGLVSARNEGEFLKVNREGTRHLVRAARNGGRPRFVLVSSMAAGGPTEPGRPLQGTEPPQPVTAYGRSKLAGERVVAESDLPWTIVRPPMVYGPRDTELLRVFKLARLGTVPVFGAGTQELSAVYGPDLAEALAAAADVEAAVGGLYYACHAERFTSGDFVRAVGRTLGRPVRLVSLPEGLSRVLLGVSGALARLAGRATLLSADKANEFFQPAWTADPTALTRDTGWAAAHDLERGLAATATWYREARWIPAERRA